MKFDNNRLINGLSILRKDLFCISVVKTLKYNFFSRHVQRRNGGLIVVYKNVIFSFGKKSMLIIDGGVSFVGIGVPAGCKSSTLFLLDPESEMIIESGSKISFSTNVVIKPKARLQICRDSYINCCCVIRCHYRIVFGEGSITGTEVDLRDINDHAINGIRKKKETIIGNHVWLGARVTVLGAKVSNGCVIGACSLVTKDIPERCIAYGVPARVHQENIDWEF